MCISSMFKSISSNLNRWVIFWLLLLLSETRTLPIELFTAHSHGIIQAQARARARAQAQAQTQPNPQVQCPAGFFLTSIAQTPVRSPVVIPQSNRPFYCPKFKVLDDTQSDNYNFVSCAFIMCGDTEVRASMCSASSNALTRNASSSYCDGDTMMRMFDDAGVQVASNDDGCGGGSLCSQIVYRYRHA